MSADYFYKAFCALINVLDEGLERTRSGQASERERFAYSLIVMALFYKDIFPTAFYAHYLQVFCPEFYEYCLDQGDFDE